MTKEKYMNFPIMTQPLDPASSNFNVFWIPASAGMTVWGLLTVSSKFNFQFSSGFVGLGYPII